MISILISSFNRRDLFRRTLASIEANCPKPFEVVVADEGSTEDVLGELRQYNSSFPWKFITVDPEEFTKVTGLKKFHNNPCLTNNVAFRHCEGEYIFTQGNEIIATEHCYQQMLDEAKELGDHYIVFSTTYDVPRSYLHQLGSYELPAKKDIPQFYSQPLQSIHYRSDVTNYISLASRKLWKRIGGYDERYFGGISAEDSDFVRRARAVPGCQTKVSEAVSLHQNHGGKTRYQNPDPKVIQTARFNEGCKINRPIFDDWDGKPENPQSWPIGEFGVVNVITNKD